VEVVPSPKSQAQRSGVGPDRSVKCTVRGFTPEVGFAENCAIGGGIDAVRWLCVAMTVICGVVPARVGDCVVGTVAGDVGTEVTVDVAGPEGCVVQPVSTTASTMQAIAHTVSDFIAITVLVRS
jgi:hypothetical protein